MFQCKNPEAKSRNKFKKMFLLSFSSLDFKKSMLIKLKNGYFLFVYMSRKALVWISFTPYNLLFILLFVMFL